VKPPTADRRAVFLTKPQARLLLELLEDAERRGGLSRSRRAELERVWNKLPHLWARGKDSRPAWITPADCTRCGLPEDVHANGEAPWQHAFEVDP